MVVSLSGTCAAATFDEQRSTISRAVESQPEAAIASLLESGLAENRPAQAVTLARGWLRQNLPENPELLHQAGRCAELSGDWPGAVALYRRFLDKADPKSERSADAITAVHSLLIDRLADEESAYSFGTTMAARLAVSPGFRQYDRRFLDTARRRNDLPSAAKRLRATVAADVPDDLLTALHTADFLWLLEGIRSVRYDQTQDRFTPDFVADVRALAKSLEFDPELALLLDWAVAVKAYNMARIDGKEAAAPLAEAKALLEKFPRHAERVQTDWAGGHNGRHYRDDPKKYWPHELEAKLAPVRAALPNLTPLQQADLLRTWSYRHYDSGPEILTPEEARAFVLENPKLVNHKAGPALGLESNKLTPDEAARLAPQLAQNPSPEASLVRAIAAGGEARDLDKAIDALLGPELWRLGKAELGGQYADRLWHWAGRPDGNAKRDQLINRSKQVAAGIPADEAAKETPADRRLQTFRTLWNDFRSPQPKQPSLRERLAALLRVTPDAVAELLRDPAPEAQILARGALAQGLESADGPLSGDAAVRGLSPHRYDPVYTRLLERHRGSVDYLKQNGMYHPYPLEPALRQVVAEQLRKSALEPWLVMAWLNAQFPENNAESLKLLETLVASPAWKSMPAEVRHGARAWFGEKAMTGAEFAHVRAADPEQACRELIALVPPPAQDAENPSAPPGLEETVAALKAAITRLREAPVRLEIRGLEALAALDPETFKDPQVISLLVELADSLRVFEVNEAIGNRLIEIAAESPDPAMLLRTSAYLWRHVERFHRPLNAVMMLTESLVDDQPEAASTLARCGLETIDRHRAGHTWFKRETDIPRLKAVRGKAAMKLGLVVIPVPATSPSYPAYRAQAEWMTGNDDTARELLDEHWDAFLTIHRELSISYLMWALQQVIYSREEARQESLIKSLLAWTTEAGSPLTPEEKVGIELAYGDIAMQRGQLREAHQIFSRTEKNEAWQDLPIRHQATLRRATAERLARDFDGALQTLAELELERVPSLWTEVRHTRAEIHFDMEEYDDAKDDVDSILARDSNHADARILLGKIQLKRQKLMEATEVELGSTTARDSLVPGEKLKVTLSDPTLAVSGAATQIEVVVWATSGDRETFLLRQFGDQKTKFRGEVATALGRPAPDDSTLQVIGDDEVFYAYSESFRERMNLAGEKRGGPILIASDALLMASARKLLTEAEQRSADMEAVMEQIRMKGSKHAETAARAELAARALDAGVRAENKGFSSDDFDRHLANVAKPGNPVHVRVVDPDRSRTAEIDELTVSVASSSGDSVSRVTLRETGTHTGWFEGSIPTAGARARAFAENSEPGRNPNMVISANDSYPAWRPVATDDASPEFVIDLNDNTPLGELTLTAAEPGAKLRTFALQTGMDLREMTTIAAYPRHQAAIKNPWHPSVVVMNDTDHHHDRNERSVYDIGGLQQQLERGWMTQTYAAGVAGNVAGPSEAMTESIPGKVKWLRQNRHHNSHVIYRFRGHFHEPRNVTRRFKVELGEYQVPQDTHPSVAHPPQFMLAVNGRPITDPENPDLLEGEVDLRPGVHGFEIWATGWDCAIGFGRSIRLLANLEEPETLVNCPDAFFDPATFPEGSLDPRNAPATIAAGDDGTSFKIAFAPDSRARFIRLLLVDQEGPAPAINRIALTSADGDAVLPLTEDFAELNKNETLEILTGDRIAVRYVDDRFVTDAKENHERFLNVAFTDARAEFADMEPRWSEKHGADMPYYEKLLRFSYDKPLSLAIHDADMDVSVEPDTIKVTLATRDGAARGFEALETGDSTGIFRLVVTPVAGAATADDQLQVATGGTITATYLDRENNRPGVPTERLATITHAAFTPPQFVLSHAEVTPWEPEAGTDTLHTLIHGFDPLFHRTAEDSRIPSERVRPRWRIDHAMLPAAGPPADGFAAVHGQSLHLELVAPQLALGMASEVEVFAQTEAGRRAAGKGGDGDFDINVPGTIALRAPLDLRQSSGRKAPEIPIYTRGEVWSSREDLQLDRFRLSIPLIPGVLPSHGVLSDEERRELQIQSQETRGIDNPIGAANRLVASPGDRIHLGFRYVDPDGVPRWLTASAKVVTHPVFDLLTEDYRSPMTSAYVGENLNLRVVDLGGDVSDQPDTVSVLVQAKSGAKTRVELRESGPHTGIFKAAYPLSYTATPGPLAEDHDARLAGIPVTYGDTVAARYTDAAGLKSDIHRVSISKGADGNIAPFSKIYQDEEIAMRTQFSLAEAYLEMARRHRKLGETDRADLEYASAKLLLSKAMDQFTDPATRAHAEYLLGTLTMEEAIASEDPETRETRFRAALSRFMTITGSYPQTIHASKAQYRIATVYEALKEPDIAAQEYVKLAYKYPDSEFLATSMARLGTHFLKQAAAYETRAKPLLAKAEEDKDAAFEGEAMQKMARREYLKTASIFGRLQERFPDHELAGQSGLRAGQAYMRAERMNEAVAAFRKVVAEEHYDGPEIRAQAMYWAAMCYQDLRQEMAAYSLFKRLTYDFPESPWAAYARAQLSQERLLNLENQLELERLEAGQ